MAVEPQERALEPEDLDRLFLERANAGDVEGVTALYEADAVLAFPPGLRTVGRDAIRSVYAELLSDPPIFAGEIRPAVRCGDLALTSTVRDDNVTAEIARRQGDGSWLWVLDQPSVR